jgi:hypothetical protein
MRRLLFPAVAAILMSYSNGYAQMAGVVGSGSGIGVTSPVGITPGGMSPLFGASPSTSAVDPTGLPLGAAGACSTTSSTTPSASTSMTSTGSSSMGTSPLGTVGATPMSSAACTQSSISDAPTTNATTSSPTGRRAPGIPMGSTELTNPGLSPAPCPTTGAMPFGSC